jgi:hypothetical protein
MLALFWNLTILAVVVTVCCVFNGWKPAVAANGCYVFIMLAGFAFAFDAALTFLVFADAQRRYGAFSTTGAFIERASSYVTACVVGLCFARLRMHRHKPRAADPVVIPT